MTEYQCIWICGLRLWWPGKPNKTEPAKILPTITSQISVLLSPFSPHFEFEILNLKSLSFWLSVPILTLNLNLLNFSSVWEPSRSAIFAQDWKFPLENVQNYFQINFGWITLQSFSIFYLTFYQKIPCPLRFRFKYLKITLKREKILYLLTMSRFLNVSNFEIKISPPWSNPSLPISCAIMCAVWKKALLSSIQNLNKY